MDKPKIVQELEDIEKFFSILRSVAGWLRLRKLEEYFSWANGKAVDDLIGYFECSQCHHWSRSADIIAELCDNCRRPGDCPKCGSDDYLIDWHIPDGQMGMLWTVYCAACGFNHSEDTSDALYKWIRG